MDPESVLAPLFTGAANAFNDMLPLAIPVAVLFIALNIGLRVGGKFGIKTR